MAAKTKQVGPRITEKDAKRLTEIYRSTNHGASEACHFWPIARDAVLRQFRRRVTFTQREVETLNQLEIPRECDQDMLIAILESQQIKCAGRVRGMKEVEAVVLIDLIQNDNMQETQA